MTKASEREPRHVELPEDFRTAVEFLMAGAKEEKKEAAEG